MTDKMASPSKQLKNSKTNGALGVDKRSPERLGGQSSL
jgi:hypothetical protein